MIGNIFLVIALLSALLSAYFYFRNYLNKKESLKYARIFFHITVTSVIVTSVFLLYLILTHQFQYNYVYSYSSKELPLGLLISTFYAGQEGSFLLWTLFLSVMGVFLQQYLMKNENSEAPVMFVFTLIQASLLLLLSPIIKNPFSLIWAGAEPAFIPLSLINPQYLNLPVLEEFLREDTTNKVQYLMLDGSFIEKIKGSTILVDQLILNGRGLNPLLQNFWMQIHPPVLFIGFASAAVPFCFAVAAMMKKEFKQWVNESLPWTLFSALILGLGIMLGGYWAYGVLGWGGYWGWDPVENSSLIPWIIIVALIHTLLIQKRESRETGKEPYLKTNLILAILSFVLVIYSTFLTRSGILSEASVHSFVAPGNTTYYLLLGLLLISLLFPLILFFKVKKSFPLPPEGSKNFLSKELALFAGSLILCASALVILLGTSSPIFGKAVEIKFYNNMNLPLAILMGLLNGLSVVVKWKETEGQFVLRSLLLSILLTILALIITVLNGVTDILMILFALSAYFTFFVNAEAAFRILKNNWGKIGSHVGHLGIAIFFLGILASSKYDETLDIKLEKNKSQEAFGYKVKFTGFTVSPDEKYYFNVELEKNGNKEIVKPVMFWSEMNQGIMKNPDISEGFAKDIYISPLAFSDGHEHENNGGFETLEFKKGESKEYKKVQIKFIGFNFDASQMGAMSSGAPFSIGADLEITVNNKTNKITPFLKIQQETKESVPVEISGTDFRISVQSLDAGTGTVILGLHSENTDMQDSHAHNEVLEVNISRKPFVSFVWIGTLIVTLGFFISMLRRVKEIRK